jgi:4'-phosphopantetheinyl transferase
MATTLAEVIGFQGFRGATYTAASSLVHCREMLTFIEDYVTMEDRVEVYRYRTKPGRARSLAARALLRALLSVTTDIPGHMWALNRCSDGRIEASAHGLRRDPHVSLSHSSHRVACAISSCGRIGVDIEHCRPGRDFASLAEFAFAEHEADTVRRHGAAAFYRIWTLREAVAKASGAGITVALGRCKVDAQSRCAKLNQQNYIVEHRSLPDGYSLGLAVKASDEKPTGTTHQ